MFIECLICKKGKWFKKSSIEKGRGKYCSKEHYYISKIGKNTGGFPKGHPNYLKHHSDEAKRKIGLNNSGKKASLETRKKQRLAKIGITPWNKGKKGVQTAWNKGKPSWWSKGEKNHFWKGGITPINFKIRNSLEYKIWREAVFVRDNWTCVLCFERGGKLEADHIKPFSLCPELRFEISNGRTLCKECHRKTPTFGGRMFNYQ